MARYLGPVCKLCRREGLKLFLKGERCYTEKCAVTRRAYPPGQHGQGRVKLSEYAVRLREKQKVRRIYGLVEKQFRKYYVTAAGSTGRTGEVMLGLLERRLDNLVYRGGFASTRSEARQLVRHKHILVNGKLVNVPSYLVQVGDVVSVRESSTKLGVVVTSLANSEKRPTLSWLGVEKGEFSLKLNAHTVRDELNEPAIREQYVVEYYSR